MEFGAFRLSIVVDGTFWLDGGAMFGIVPKVLWNRLTPADEMNRIKLSLNCLLIQTTDTTVLVDTGIGELKERYKEMYCVERPRGLFVSLKQFGIEPEEVDFVINTHLHFDHCGGNTIKKGKQYVPAFSNAKYVIQKQEWFDATHPNERTQASYIQENFMPLETSGNLVLVDGEHEVVPGIKVFITNGHTHGHQSVLIESQGKKALYLGDLIPTSSHIKIPYVMGYDLYPLDVIEKKKEVLDKALKEQWLLIFEHDPDDACAYIHEEEGRIVVHQGGWCNEK